MVQFDFQSQHDIKTIQQNPSALIENWKFRAIFAQTQIWNNERFNLKKIKSWYLLSSEVFFYIVSRIIEFVLVTVRLLDEI